MARPRSLAVVGGGTAGYFAALAVKRRFPSMTVTLVESRRIPVIGVGEATTTLMPPFLHAQLGLDIIALWRQVRPTFKLGVRFEWGLPASEYNFAFPFDATNVIDAASYDRDLHAQSLVSLLMHERRSPVLRGPDGEIVSLLPSYKFAYHLDNRPFVDFLASASRQAGILHEEMTIDEVALRRDGRGIDALRGGGRELRNDFYVDASGFAALLVGKTLGAPFRSYAPSLFCDRAVVATVPQGEVIDPYTTAQTMDAGWCWRIPVTGADHRGYVHSSAFLDEASAIAEMRAANPSMGDPWVVKFRSGRHEEFWRHNVAAVGNAYGFVEPLESTALHMVIVEIAYLLAGLELPPDAAAQEQFQKYANDAVGGHWDYLRWFLALHYKYNRRRDTPFWRAARSDVDITGLDDIIARYRREGAGPWMDGRQPMHGDPAFGFSGIATMLLGQGVSADLPPRPSMSQARWSRRASEHRRVAAWALPQREALEVLRSNPQLLSDFASSSRSWCTGPRERIAIAGPGSAPGKIIAD